jgi:DNA-binding beta-propeller fold protein YncE
MTTGIAATFRVGELKNSNVGPRKDIRLIRLILLMGGVLTQPLFAASLAPQPPVELTGTHGKFDFIKVDETRARLLACHTGNGSLDVIHEASSKLIKSIPTGNAQGVAIDDKNNRYFVSVSKPPQLVIVDATKLEVTGTVSLPGPADVCTYSPALNRVVVDDDEKPEQWVVDPDALKIVQTITYPGTGMEDLAFNGDGHALLQNIKDASLLAWADPQNANVGDVWPTAPAEKPHGLAMVGRNEVLVAGGNGKLVLIDDEAGKVVASGDIAPRVDEIAFDPGLGLVYCASGTGVISVVSVGPGTLGPSETATSAPGAHSIAVDTITHTVWIVFAREDKAYVQSFLAGKP